MGQNSHMRAIGVMLVVVFISCAITLGTLGCSAAGQQTATQEAAAPEANVTETAETTDGFYRPGDAYRLEQVVVLSRHNIRSPMSGSGSTLAVATPHEWFAWTSNPSELSLRGGALETMMGQYFRQWLEAEELIPENYQPTPDEVRFYANAKQRTIATSQYFSSGMLPVANVPIETHAAYDTMDPVFTPQITFLSDSYEAAAMEELSAVPTEPAAEDTFNIDEFITEKPTTDENGEYIPDIKFEDDYGEEMPSISTDNLVFDEPPAPAQTSYTEYTEAIDEIRFDMDAIDSTSAPSAAAVIKGEKKVTRMVRRDSARTVRTDTDPLIAALRKLRQQLAENEHVPAYVVFSDATLKQIAQRKPLTKGKLKEIQGMGKKKVNKYGARIIKTVKNSSE